MHSTFLLSTLAFLLAVSIIVAVHELGHLFAARACGVPVETFSLGLGPEVFGFTDRRRTRWSVSLLPLGGYIHIPPEKLRRTGYWQQVLIYGSGPLANFVLAVVGFAVVAYLYGQPVKMAKTTDELMKVLNGGAREYPTMFAALQIGFERVWWMITATMDYFRQLMIAQASFDSMAGPVGIAQVSGQVAMQYDALLFAKFVLALSVALGVFNSLPIPPLDGGKIVLAIVAAVFGFREKLELAVATVGALSLIVLLAVLTWKDILRLF